MKRDASGASFGSKGSAMLSSAAERAPRPGAQASRFELRPQYHEHLDRYADNEYQEKVVTDQHEVCEGER
jgi:hypothetical protein